MSINRLGKYKICEKLGEGATADVYHAVDTSLDREVALKLLKPALVADPFTFERFHQEARAAAVLFHPNIATVLEFGEDEGRYFIAMRYIEGRSLDQVLQEDGPLPWDEVLHLAGQLGEALDYAHSEGFLHRDVKPSNIIQSKNGDYVLTDFGLVRAMMNTGITTHTGALLGTPAYIAPEIWNGEEASPASDQYALACVLYEAITGEILFGGSTPQEIITKHLIKRPEINEDWPEGTTTEFGDTLTKALSKEPQQRFENIKILGSTMAVSESFGQERTHLETNELAKREADEITKIEAKAVEKQDIKQYLTSEDDTPERHENIQSEEPEAIKRTYKQVGTDEIREIEEETKFIHETNQIQKTREEKQSREKYRKSKLLKPLISRSRMLLVSCVIAIIIVFVILLLLISIGSKYNNKDLFANIFPPPTLSSTLPDDIKILIAESCDPRVMSDYCGNESFEVFENFFSVLENLNADFVYGIPREQINLAAFDVIVVDFCATLLTFNQADISLLDKYIRSGGSAIVMGHGFCGFGFEYPDYLLDREYEANTLTSEYGIDFNSEEIGYSRWTTLISKHPITTNITSLYTFADSGSVSLNVVQPSEALAEVDGMPFIALYDGDGTIVAIGFSEFFRGTDLENYVEKSDNFLFWDNMLRWLIQKSRQKLAQNTYLDPSEIVAENSIFPTSIPTRHVELAESISIGYAPIPAGAESRIGKGQPNSIAISPRGDLVAVGSDFGVFYYQVDTFELVRFDNTDYTINDIAFSPDGSTLAVCSGMSDVELWDVYSGNIIDRAINQSSSSSIAFSPNGKTIVTGSYDNVVEVWDAISLSNILTINEHNIGELNDIAFSPDGFTFATGHSDGRVILWDVTSGEKRISIENIYGNYGIESLVFSPDGEMIVGSVNRIGVILWDRGTGKELHKLQIDSTYMNQLAFSPDGNILAVTSLDPNLIFWETSTWAALQTVDGHSDASLLSFSPDGQMLVTASVEDERLILWDVTSGEQIISVRGHLPIIENISYSPDGETIALGTWDGVYIYDTLHQRKIINFDSNNLVDALDFSTKGNLLASEGKNGSVIIRDTLSWDTIQTLTNHLSINCIRFSPTGDKLAVGAGSSSQGEIRIWNPRTGENEITIRDLDTSVQSISYSPDGNLLAIGLGDSQLLLADPNSGRIIHKYEGHSDGIIALSFSPDGNWLASGSSDRKVSIWDTDSGVKVKSENLGGYVFSLAFSPDGNLLAATLKGNEVIVWNTNNWTYLDILEGHKSLVVDLHFSPDGSNLATGSWDGTVIIWSVDELGDFDED